MFITKNENIVNQRNKLYTRRFFKCSLCPKQGVLQKANFIILANRKEAKDEIKC